MCGQTKLSKWQHTFTKQTQRAIERIDLALYLQKREVKKFHWKLLIFFVFVTIYLNCSSFFFLGKENDRLISKKNEAMNPIANNLFFFTSFPSFAVSLLRFYC